MASRPSIAHLWFERDARSVDGLGTDVLALGAHVSQIRRGLLERAAAAVALTDGDVDLQARLDRVAAQ